MIRIAISESSFDSASRDRILSAIPTEDWVEGLETLFRQPGRIFSLQLRESSAAFLLYTLSLALAFARCRQHGSRLYIDVETACALSTEALHEVLNWLSSDLRFEASLPPCDERSSLFEEWQALCPPPFSGRQRVHLMDGAVIIDLKFVAKHDDQSDTWTYSLPDSRPAIPGKRIAVLGSGLAGCHLAAALADKGADVTVLERSSRPHDGASGNRQGALYIKPGLNWSRENELHVLSYLYASRRYGQRFDKLTNGPWSHSGVLHLAQSEREAGRMATLHSTSAYPASFIRQLGAEEAELEAGTAVNWPASLMPHGGTLEPGKLCSALLNHPSIKLVTDAKTMDPVALGKDYDAIVWAGGYPSSGDALAPSRLPLRAIRGQLSSALLADTEACPKRVLSGEGYVMPPVSASDSRHHGPGQWLTFGASYHVNSADTALRQTDSDDNIAQLVRTLPRLAERIRLAAYEHNERAGLRCASTDYMPVAGQAMSDQLAADSAAVSLIAAGKLWFMTSFGSKGLALTPLLAEHLACRLLGEPHALEAHLSAACEPDRFRARTALKARQG